MAILGLGEVGRIYGAALAAAGHEVLGYDPYSTGAVEGLTVLDDLEAAVERADMVFTLTPASVGLSVAREAAPALRPGTLYADFTSAAPAAKQELTGVFACVPGVRPADVAILGPVVQLGAGTPLMTAGPGARALAPILRTLGADVQVVEGEIGAAMGHKLVRSVFMKSLAAAVTEAVRAGRAAGHEEWIRGQIARELSGDGQGTIDRFLRGSVLHAARRHQEMESVAGYLDDLGVTPTMSRAAAEVHRALQDESAPAQTG
ncbi:phosphogluconate dehydrogenase [Brachybacterium sp. P6-10-X1]|nr:phosphogluconate dehydrogenase [Brachybacterium sp. P6-10-X1]